jgi:hypothetical protein
MTGKEILVSHHTTTGTLKTTLVDTLILAQQIDAALDSEREACAKLAEDRSTTRCMHHEKNHKGSCGRDIAAAIRARGTP